MERKLSEEKIIHANTKLLKESNKTFMRMGNENETDDGTRGVGSQPVWIDWSANKIIFSKRN